MTDSYQNAIILVVDDNPQNIQVLGRILRENGYDFVFARNGEQALKYLKTEKPDLILLDIMMPGMDGFEVCKIIIKQYSPFKIPVIFVTAKTESADITKGFETGAVDYITKPFKTPELLARVKLHLELKRARDEIKTLQGIIPICARCKKIRDEKGVWDQIENYISKHSDAMFSHGICSDCSEVLYGKEDWFQDVKDLKNKKKS